MLRPVAAAHPQYPLPHPAPPAPLRVEVLPPRPAQRGAAVSTQMAQVSVAAQAVAAAGGVHRHLMFSSNNQVDRLLQGADAVFGSMRQMMAAARREILLQGYAWQDSSSAAGALRAGLWDLCRAQRQRGAATAPVMVHIFLRRAHWPIPCKHETSQLQALIRRMDPHLVQVHLWDHHECAFGALHSKVLVIDGHSALLTGANPEHHFDWGRSWFDTGCVVRGGVVQAMRADTLDVWRRCRCQAANVATPALPALQILPAAPQRLGVPMLAISRRGEGRLWSHSAQNPYDQAVLSAIGAARSSIFIMTPNFNVAKVARALAAACRRGVHCALLLPHGFNNFTSSRFFWQGGGNAGNVRRLARACTQARGQLQVRWFSGDGVRISRGNGPEASHAKGMCIDDQLLILGSGNLDRQSFYHSRELGVVVDDAQVARRWLHTIYAPVFARAIAVAGLDL